MKLNLGSFTTMLKQDFINIDILDLKEFAEKNGFIFRQMDLRRGLPYESGSVSFINMSHLIEHFTLKEAAELLKECYRVLKPKGKLRIGTPSLEMLTEAYMTNSMDKFNEHQPDDYKKASNSDKFWRIVTSGHKTIYDYTSLFKILRESGFTEKKSEYNKDFDMYPDHTIFVEVTKNVQKQTISRKKRKVKVKDKLDIGVISTPMLQVFPKNYGGLESIVGDLSEALAKMGHNVTVFAPDGSKLEGVKVVECGPEMGKVQCDWLQAEKTMYEVYKDQLSEFDIVHGMNWFGFEYLAKSKNPDLNVTHTHHGGLNMEWWGKSKPAFNLNLIAISEWMKSVYEKQGFTAKHVYNGINTSKYPYRRKKGDRLLFVGRFDKFKQPHVAIEVAKKLDTGLDLVGGTFVQDLGYLNKIRAMADGKQIRMHENVDHATKVKFYQRAKCTIFPSKMGEPFGLIVPESCCCGTPVVGTNDGAIPETLKEGGILCMDESALVEGVKQIGRITPLACKKNGLRFSREIMAANYLKLYRDILAGKSW